MTKREMAEYLGVTFGWDTAQVDYVCDFLVDACEGLELVAYDNGYRDGLNAARADNT
ncbi:MAG: hypothetical protein [Bacteriophage sp.]|nr:MAG: hypothetical protein [Bacteriophage sp.]